MNTKLHPLRFGLFFVPVVGMALAVLIEGERFGMMVWLGTAVVLAGIAVGILRDSRDSGVLQH